MLNRRDFSRQLAVAGVAGSLTGVAQAQGGPVEGTHFVRLQTQAPVTLPEGKKIEIVEFFSYECPHCNTFDPIIHEWSKKLPADVSFRQIPVGFVARYQAHQRMFYALEEMGQLATIHRRFFTAIHVQGRRFNNDADVLAYVKEQGVDADRFSNLVKSFQVTTKANRARQLTDAYKIDGVPTVGVHGRFYTSAALAGSHERALAVVDVLMQRIRQNKA